MTILYKGFQGFATISHAWGNILFVIAGLIIFGSIVMAVTESDRHILVFALLAIIPIFVGISLKADTRVPIVKALVDDKIPYLEVFENYEYMNRQGQVYTFKVKNVSKTEWELEINEQQD